MSILSTTLCLLAVTPQAQARQSMASLDFLIGTWAGKQTMAGRGETFAGGALAKITWTVAGSYIQEQHEVVMPGPEVNRSLRLIGYDPQFRQFRAWWFNPNSSAPVVLEGILEGKKITFSGEGDASTAFRASYEGKTKDTLFYQYQVKRSNKWDTILEIAYERKKEE